MKRREFIAGLAGAATWPLETVRGQESRKILRVGAASTFPKRFPLWVAFQERLRELGYVEGRNISFEYLELPDHGAIGEAMRELVRRDVEIIVDAGEEVTLQAAMAATTTIPIVMLAVTYDPVMPLRVEHSAIKRKCYRSLPSPTGARSEADCISNKWFISRTAAGRPRRHTLMGTV